MIVAFKWSKTECVVEEVCQHFLRILINSGMRSIVKHPKIFRPKTLSYTCAIYNSTVSPNSFLSFQSSY